MKLLRHLIALLLLISISMTLRASELYWDADGTAAGNDPTSGLGLGGSSNWDQITPLWFNGAGDIIWTNANSDDAIFSGTAGTVTLTENINAGNVYFTNVTGNYVLTNATGVETLTVAGTIDTGGSDAIIGAQIANSTTLTKSGNATLHLPVDSSATLTGQVNVNQGALSIENNNALGYVPVTVNSGAELDLNGNNNTVVNNITLNGGSGVTNNGAICNISGTSDIYGSVTVNSSSAGIGAHTGTLYLLNGIGGTGNDVNIVVSNSTTSGTAGQVRFDGGNINLGNNGSITVNSGTLEIGAGASYSTTYSNVVVNGGEFAFTVDKNLGTTPASLITNAITLNGGIFQFTGTASNNVYRGITVTSTNAQIQCHTGTWGLANLYSPNLNVTFNSAATTAHINMNGRGSSNVLNIGTASIIKIGPGTFGTDPGTVTYSNLIILGGGISFSFGDTSLGTLPTSFCSNNIYLNNGSGLGWSHSTTFSPFRGIYVDTNGTATNGGYLQNLTSGANSTWQGVISGPGNFRAAYGNVNTKMTLTGSNTYSGMTTIDSPVTLVIGAGGSTGTLGAGNLVTNAGWLDFNRSDIAYNYGGIIIGTGAVVQVGSGLTTLTGNSTYTGPTIVSNGTLIVDGSLTSPNINVSGTGTFGGPGPFAGAVTVSGNGALYLGNGTMTVGGSLALNGNASVLVNKSALPTSGIVSVAGALSSSGTGTIFVTNTGTALHSGDSFQLFSGPVSGGGTLHVVGSGMIWNNNLASSGTISVQSVEPKPIINQASLSGANFIFSGTNGYSGGTYNLLATTNIALPFSQWTSLQTGSFNSDGTFSLTNAVVPGTPQKFYTLQLQ
jgi:fibronectin-binding autotransporter adhesin